VGFQRLIPLVGLAGFLALGALVGLGRSGAETAAEHRLLDAVRTAAGGGLLLGALTSQDALVAAALVAGGMAVGLPALRWLLPGWSLSTAVTVAFGCAGGGAAVALAVTRRLPLHGAVAHEPTASASASRASM
jgi:hypothetical protein